MNRRKGTRLTQRGRENGLKKQGKGADQKKKVEKRKGKMS